MVGTRRWVGGGVVRSINQVAVSVVATLIATALYSGIRNDGARVETPAPPLTTGGKFAARIDGAVAETIPAEPMGRPTISIVNWAFTPTTAPLLIDDVAWEPLDAPAPVAAPLAKPVRVGRDLRHAALVQSGEASRVKSPVAIPQLDLQTAPGIQAAARHGLWSTTTAALESGTTTAVQTVAAIGEGVLSHLIP